MDCGAACEWHTRRHRSGIDPASFRRRCGSTHQEDMGTDSFQVHAHDPVIAGKLTRIKLESGSAIFHRRPPSTHVENSGMSRNQSPG
jgi:hypothetical protein